MNMTKPRIYFLVNSLEGGGAERVITNISSKLKDWFDIDIITLKSGTFYELPEWVRHIPLSHWRNNINMILLFPWLLLEFKKILKSENYTNGISFLEIANFIHILAKKDAIISFRTSIGVFRWMIWSIYQSLIGLLYPRAKCIIVNSEENRYELAEYLQISPEKVVTIYNPIDIETAITNAQEPVESEIIEKIAWKKVFITVARLVNDDAIGSKNHALILRIFKKLKEQGKSNFIYLIVWDGPAMSSLQAQVEKDWLRDHVVFVWKQKNVFKYLTLAHFVIFASRHEGFPNALIEALAMKVPIITSNFKTWAHEVILGNFENNKKYQYPLFWPNGVILDIDHFEIQFFEIFGKIDTIQSKQIWLDRFIESEKKFLEIIS